jgi:hypothetical protein
MGATLPSYKLIHETTIDAESGFRQYERFLRDERIHRNPKDGPAQIMYHMDKGTPAFEQWFWEGQLHRPLNEGPAQISYSVGGKVIYEAYYVSGILHRPAEDGPALRRKNERVIQEEEYVLNGKLHREPSLGPARIKRHKDITTLEEFYVNGRLHRDPSEGPAHIRRHGHTGVMLEQTYWVNGEQVPAPRPTGSPARPRRPDGLKDGPK